MLDPISARFACSDGEYHSRRYVHVVKHGSLVLLGLISVTAGYIFTDEMSFFIQLLIRLRYVVIVFLVRSHIFYLIGNPRVLRIRFIDLTIRCLHESILVDPCERSQGVDQTDVRSLRCLDGAHSSVMGIVYVSNLESGTVS